MNVSHKEGCMMNQTVKLILVLFLDLSLFAGTLGCNTIEGMGKDLEAAGEAIKKEASD
mgnify:FL=1